MSGSIRLFVDAAACRGDRRSPRRRRRRTTSAPSCGAAAGDAVRLFNGRDGELAARIDTDRGGDRATCWWSSSCARQAPEPDLWLVFALLKRDATDLVVQKATELGRRRAAAGDDRTHQCAPGERGPACRHRDRGGRTVRAADRARAARAAVARRHCWPTGRPAGSLFAGRRASAPRPPSARSHGPCRTAGRSRRRLHAGGA